MNSEFAPFDSRTLVCGQVENIKCIQSWRDLLLVGRSDGSLTVLKSAIEPGNPAGTLIWKPSTVKRLGQQILQLAVSVDRSLLFCLTEEGVNLLSLPQLMLKGQAGRTSGSSCFSWDDSTNQLAVAVKRRVLVFNYDGLEFVNRREISTAEAPVALQILGSTVFIASKKEYSALLSSGTLLKIKLPVVGTPSSSFAASLREVLLTVGNQTFIADESGTVSNEPIATWSRTPSAVQLSGEFIFLVAVLPEGIEVRLFSTPREGVAEVCQRVEMKDVMSMVCVRVPEGGVFAAAAVTGPVVYVPPQPPLKQAGQLLHVGVFEEALAICRQILDTQEQARVDLETRIRFAYGRHLLSEQKYEEAMLNLGMSDPLEILRSFPFLVPDSLAQKVSLQRSDLAQTPLDTEIPKLAAILIPYLLSYRSRLVSGALDRKFHGGGTAAAAAAAAAVHSDRISLQIVIDTALLRALLVLPDNGALLQFLERPNSVDLEVSTTTLLAAGRYAELVSLYTEKGDYAAALLILEKLTTKLHSTLNNNNSSSSNSSSKNECFEVPPQGAAIELSGQPGIWAAIKLLSSMEPVDFSLVASNAKWLIAGDKDAFIEMLFSFYPDIAPSAALPILSNFGPEVAASYLHKIIEAGAEEEAYHQELAMLYLRQQDDESSVGRLRDLILTSSHLDFEGLLRKLPSGEKSLQIRAALLERLERHLDTLRIYIHSLHSLPLAEAYCDRVISKQRPTSNFWKMPEPVVMPGQVYAVLVQVMLEEEDASNPGTYKTKNCHPEDPVWHEISVLLGKKRDAMHPLQALSLLPQQVPLSSCVYFIEGAIQAMKEERRKTSILISLYRGKSVCAHQSLVTAQQVSVTVNQEKACSICHKRLALGGLLSAVVHLPQGGGAMVHYSCYRKKYPGNKINA